MNQDGFETYYIKEKELFLLLAGKGMEHFYGIATCSVKGKMSIPNKEQIHELLAGLYQKNYIEWEDQMVVIKEPINQYVEGIMGASVCMIVEEKEKTKPVSVFYFSKNGIILLESSMQQNEMLRLTSLKEDEFLNVLWELDCFPEEELLLESEEDSDHGWKEKTEFTLRAVSDGRQIEKLIIREKGIFTQLIRKNEQENIKFSYKKEMCRDIFREWRSLCY